MHTQTLIQLWQTKEISISMENAVRKSHENFAQNYDPIKSGLVKGSKETI